MGEVGGTCVGFCTLSSLTRLISGLAISLLAGCTLGSVTVIGDVIVIWSVIVQGSGQAVSRKIILSIFMYTLVTDEQ